MYLHHYGWIFRFLFPSLIWNVPTKEKELFLTFDDGPIPEVTEWVLDILKSHDVKATFFCVGENIRKHPQVFQRIINEGHLVANHTSHHMNGKKFSTEEYIEDVRLCEEMMGDTNTKKLFRPPYGKLKRSQRIILQKEYKIIMWEVLSADFDPKLSPEKCLEKTVQYTKEGSIVLFHDSVKTIQKIEVVLPAYLAIMKAKGFKFSLFK